MNAPAVPPRASSIRLTVIIVAALVSAVVAGWYAFSARRPETSRLESVSSWAYQIQKQNLGRNIEKLARSRYDLLVIDQTRSIKGEERYDSKSDVARLKNSRGSKGSRKIVLSYIDVGEAETYRWYWQKNWRVGKPDWIVAEDPDGWDGNYPVKFWRREWRAIIQTYVDRIISDGYDGLYLDWLEVYSFGPVARAARRDGLDPRAELVTFVSEIARYARAKNPEFILVGQNAAELGAIPRYARIFDGVAQEAIWYDGAGDPDSSGRPGDVDVDPRDRTTYLAELDKWKAQGKTVFNVEYAERPANVRRAYRVGAVKDYKTYVTLRSLDRVSATPPPGY